MPRYLFRASYSVEGVKGLLSKGGTARQDAIREELPAWAERWRLSTSLSAMST
jgi:hypothetical protein